MLPPFGKHRHVWFIVFQQFGGKALPVQDVAVSCVLVGLVLGQVRIHVGVFGGLGPSHQLVDVGPRSGNWQEPHRRQNGVAAADPIRNHKSFPAGRIGFGLQSAALAVRGGVNPVVGFFFPVLVDQQFLKDPEGNRWFRRRPGLGNHVDREVLVANQFNQIVDVRTGQGVPGKDHQRSLAGSWGLRLIEAVVQEVNGHPSTQVRAPDPDNDQDFGVTLDLFSGRLNPGKFFLVVVGWQVQPVAEVRSGTRALPQLLVRGVDHCLHFAQFVIVNKLLQR